MFESRNVQNYGTTPHVEIESLTQYLVAGLLTAGGLSMLVTGHFCRNKNKITEIIEATGGSSI